MATIGQQLLHPESGWKRYDDTDSNISYMNHRVLNLSNLSWFNNTGHETWDGVTYNTTGEIKFNFIKDRIRLYFVWHSDRSSNIEIYIDGILYIANTKSNDTNVSKLTFEKTNLLNQEHIVHIITNGHTILDAIDIDENGELKPYNLSISLITWNPNDKTGNYTLSNNNLTAYLPTTPPYGYNGIKATKFIGNGKFYAEFLVNDMPNVCTLGLATYDANLSGYTSITQFPNNIKTSVISATKNAFIGMAFDLDNHVINFYINGVLDINSTIILEKKIYTVIMMNNNGENKGGTITANFGATPFNIVSSNKSTWNGLVDKGYKPYDVYNANWEWRVSKYLIKQNSNYYSINNNYIDLGEIDNNEELYNLIDEYGYDDLSIITKELDNKKIPTKLENDYYKSFGIDLNHIKDTINLIEENDKKYIEYSCNNYKISDKIKEINNGKFEVLMRE